MITPVPTLSAAGWVNTPNEKADMLISHFFESDKYQTYLYGNNIASLTWIIEQNNSNINNVTVALREALETYLGNYYESVQVDVQNNDDPTTNPTGKVELKIYCNVMENGREYSFGRLVSAINSKIDKITKLNNIGNAL